MLDFPLPFLAPGHYKLDFSELPVMIGSFAFGPVAGVLVEFCKVVLKIIIKGTDTAFVGDLANFTIGCRQALCMNLRKPRKAPFWDAFWEPSASLCSVRR